MTWRITYKKSVKKDLKQISPEMKRVIKQAIEEKLCVNPVRFGIPLRGTLKGYFKFRISDYRIIYTADETAITVHVIKIGHRREVYKTRS